MMSQSLKRRDLVASTRTSPIPVSNVRVIIFGVRARSAKICNNVTHFNNVPIPRRESDPK